MDQLSALCRTCLSSSNCLDSLDTECEQGYSLKFMLTSFCTLQMDDISVMYDNICKDCSSEILRAYNFKLQCEQNDVLLREKARALKYEEVCKKEGNYSSGVVEISFVKNEVEDVHVKEEDWMRGDEEDDTHNDFDIDDETSTQKKENDSDTSTDVPLRRTRSDGRSASEGRSKPTPRRKNQLIDNSFETLGYKRIYECPKCGGLFRLFSVIHAHLDKIHDIVLKSVKEFDEMCSQERKAKGIQESQEEDKDFKKFDPKNPMYKCIECPYRCKDYEVMKKHIVDQHREAKYIKCSEEDCQYSTHDVRNFSNHVKLMHKNERKYSCDKCDFKTHNKSYMDTHYTTKHLNIKPFVCQLCSAEFVCKQGLTIHTAMKHEKELKFFCPTCAKGFFTKRHMKVHMKVHLGLRPHVCEHCGRAFTQKGNLEKHVFTSHTSSQDDSVLCSQCSFKAKNIYSLYCHMTRIHGERTKFYCDYCGMGFVRKTSLKPHIWKHIGWEPFKCPTCDKSCDSNSHLQTHMMKHTGERPFQCQYCDYASTSKDPLKRHIESHLNELKYKCHLCPYSANRKASLRRHHKTKCGTLTRKYTPYKNKAAIDFTQFNISHQIMEDSGPSTSSV